MDIKLSSAALVLLYRGIENQVNPSLSVKRQRTQREREQELSNSWIKVTARSTKQTIQRNRNVYLVIWSCHRVVLSFGKALHVERSYYFRFKTPRNVFHVLMYCLLNEKGVGFIKGLANKLHSCTRWQDKWISDWFVQVLQTLFYSCIHQYWQGEGHTYSREHLIGQNICEVQHESHR